MAYRYEDGDPNDMEEEEEDEDASQLKKKSNILPVWGNEKTMNLNTLVLTNIQSSQYFKTNLYALKTYHEVLDEIYYQVSHLEPWEKGSRKTSGQTGMCGGVRGVGAGGIVSTAFCILYKLFTLRLTRKQVNGMLNHTDSPYIRGLGFMYLRYTQPPPDLWSWMEPYLEDEETLDVRAGGGQTITIGEMARQMLTKLEWHATLFPRIPVPIQKQIEKQLQARDAQAMQASAVQHQNWRNNGVQANDRQGDRRGGSGSRSARCTPDRGRHSNSRSRMSTSRSRANSHDSGRRDSRHRDSDGHRDRETDRYRDKDTDRYRDKDTDRYREKEADRYRDRDGDRHRDPDRDRNGERDRNRDRERDTEKYRDKERDRDRKDRDVDRDRDRGKDRDRDSRKDRDREGKKERDRHQDRDRNYHDHRERNRSGRSSRERRDEGRRRSRTRSRSRDRYRR